MTQDQPSRLDQLETALARFAEIQLQTNVRQDQLMTQVQEQTRQNSVAIAQLTNRVDALTTSTTETIQLVAQNSREIRQIWEYLLQQRPNGRSDG